MKKQCLILFPLLVWFAATQAQTITWGKIEKPKAFMTYWDISEEHMKAYENYMEMDGKYQHAHLNPLYVLSIISDSPEEKGYFAAKAAKHEHEITKKEIETAWLISKEMEKQGLIDAMQQFTDNLTGIDTISYQPDNISRNWVAGDTLVMVIDDVCVLETCINRFIKIGKSLPEQVNTLLLNKRKQAIPEATIKQIKQKLPANQISNYDPIEHHALENAINQLVHLRADKIIRKL